MTFVVILSILALAVLAGGLIISKLVYVCQPNEVLIFTGTRRRLGAKTVGYHLVQGGRGVRMPLLERVHRLDLTNMVIDLRVEGAYSRGGIPLNVEGVANLKIASDESTLANAIERFLGRNRADIVRTAKETLEGNLRGVLATLTPEEVNEDRVKFAQNLLHEADADLKKLGLVLDTLKIQNVSDDKGYLDSIGRKQTAELTMRSRIAEAENRAMARIRAAENHRQAAVAKVSAERKLAAADAERRIVDARTKQEAMIAEHRGRMRAKVAKAHGELEVQRQQIERVKLQLEADQVKKAQAKRGALIDQARGQAARIVEDGKAQADALRSIAHIWEVAGDDAAQIFMAQKMRGLINRMLSNVQNTPVDRITIVDKELAQGNAASRATVAAHQLEETMGIDVPGLLKRFAPSAG